MQRNTPLQHVKKTIPALAAAFAMTALIALAVVAFGLNALFNTHIAQAAAQSSDQTSSQADQATIQQLQATIAQYQTRETQYQQELQQAADQVNQANQQNEQYQQLITALQNAGVIQITQDGRVFIQRNSALSTQPRGDDD